MVSTCLITCLKLITFATYIPDASAVIDNDDLERGVLTAVPAPEEVPTDAAKPVDRHLELRLRWRPHGVPSGSLTQVNQFRIPCTNTSVRDLIMS